MMMPRTMQMKINMTKIMTMMMMSTVNDENDGRR